MKTENAFLDPRQVASDDAKGYAGIGAVTYNKSNGRMQLHLTYVSDLNLKKKLNKWNAPSKLKVQGQTL